jgi:hypothetical protein
MERDILSMLRLLISMVSVVVLLIVSVGCATSGFSDDKVRSLVEAQPLRLDGEQVSLTGDQVDCGVHSDLWEKPVESSPGHTSARLTAEARGLKFSDDVLTDPAFRRAYVQVKGEFPLQVLSVGATKDVENGMKVVEVMVGVKIQHACFPNPLPLMGVKKGNFRDDVPVAFRFKFADDDWRLDQLLHQ